MDTTHDSGQHKEQQDASGSAAEAARDASRIVRVEASRLVAAMRAHPSIGFVLAGGVGLIAAMTIGVGEVAVAVAAGYLAARYLRGHRDGHPHEGGVTESIH
jgi:hypothetical protein